MPGILISIDAWNRVTNGRVTIRAGVARNTATLGADGFIWEPAVQTLPRFGMQLMDADMTGQLMVGVATVALNMRNLRRVPSIDQLIFEGAPVTIYIGDGPRLPLFRKQFVGRVVSGVPDVDTGILALTLQVDRVAVDQPMLTKLYGGGGGADGDVELRGRTKPAAFGRPINVPPVLIDSVNAVYQFDAYGNTTGLAGVYENLASFGDSVGNYATYAALVAATIPPGRYGTCLAEGMFRLGVSSTRAITCDPVCGAGTAGTMALRWLQVHAGIPTARIRATDFTALDTALSGLASRTLPVNHYLAESTSVLELWQRLASSCNAVPLLMLDGTFGMSRIVGGDVVMTLEQGGQPTVTAWKNGETPTPWWRTRLSAARSYYVNGPGDIDFGDTINDLGDWKEGETYRLGNIVRFTDGARYLYVGTTPSATPPPAAFIWEEYEAAPDATQIRYPSGATLAEKEPAEGGADVTGDHTSKDTNAVGGRPATEVKSTLDLNGRNILAEVLRSDATEKLIAARTLLNGKPIGTVIGESLQTQEDLNDVFIQNFAFMGAKKGDDSGWIFNTDTIGFDDDSGEIRTMKQLIGDIDGHSADILNLQEILLDDDGVTLRGIMLLTLDGKISGIVNTLNGTRSTFDIMTNALSVINERNGIRTVPFKINENDQIEMLDVLVGKFKALSVDSSTLALFAIRRSYAVELAGNVNLPFSSGRVTVGTITLTKETAESALDVNWFMRLRPGGSYAGYFELEISGRGAVDQVWYWQATSEINGVRSVRGVQPYGRRFDGIPAGTVTLKVSFVYYGHDGGTGNGYIEAGSSFSVEEKKR